MTDLQDYYSEAERQFAQAERELDEAERDQANAQRRLLAARERHDALASVLAGLRRLRGVEAAARWSPEQERLPGADDAATVTSRTSVYSYEGDPPRGREAVMIILGEVPRTWHASDLTAEIVRRGWIDPDAKNPEAAVRVALKRLEDAGLIDKIAPATYRARPSGVTTPETDDAREEEHDHAAA